MLEAGDRSQVRSGRRTIRRHVVPMHHSGW